MPETLSPVRPPVMNSGVAPSASLQQRYDQATASGDPVAVKDVAPIAVGTTLAQASKQSANFMDNRLAPLNAVVKAAGEKGGIAVAEGRIAAADNIKKNLAEWKKLQPDTSIWNGVANTLMGVPDAWKAMTQGQITTRYEADKFGKFYAVSYAQNNPLTPLVVVDPETNIPLSPQEYAEKQFKLYADAASNPFLQGIGETFKKNTAAYQTTAARTNQSAAAYEEIGKNAKESEALLTDISSNYNLNNKQLNELHAITNKVTSLESTISDSVNTLNSGTTTDSKREALEKLKALGGNIGLEGFGVNAKGQIVDSTGKTVGTQDLTQKVKDYMKKNNLSSQYTQAKDDLIKSAVYQSLPTVEAKANLLKAMNLIQSNHTRMNELKTSDIGELPFLTTSIPHKMGDPFQVGIISTIFDQANAAKAAAFSSWFAEESKKFPKDKPPVAGQLEAAFARSPVMQQINDTFAKRIKEAESRKYPEAPSDSLVGTNIGGTPLPALAIPDEKPKAPTPKERSIKPAAKKAPVDFAADFLNSRKK